MIVLPLRRLTALICLGCCLCLGACGSRNTPVAAVQPFKAEPVAHESELLKLTLTPEAEARLGLATVPVAAGTARLLRSAHGEVVVAPFAGGIPASSTTDLATLGASQIRADGDLARLRAELQVAEKAFARAEGLVLEEAGSVRVRDEAESALGVARANLATAEAQRRLLGPAIAAMGRQGGNWVRVAAFASDLDSIDTAAAANVRTLGANAVTYSARPAEGPPSANASAGTVDLYYALADVRNPLRVGQRVSVGLPLLAQGGGILTPASAILRDIHGGEWVYVRVAPRAYERRRVEVASLQNDQALVVRGLLAGAEVVSAGAMELFGAEFGAK